MEKFKIWSLFRLVERKVLYFDSELVGGEIESEYFNAPSITLNEYLEASHKFIISTIIPQVFMEVKLFTRNFTPQPNAMSLPMII